MVEIKLISFLNDIAKLECYPNGDKARVFILTVNVIDKRIIDCSIDTQYNSYVSHAAWKIFNEYKNTGTIPQTTVSVWC